MKNIHLLQSSALKTEKVGKKHDFNLKLKENILINKNI